MKHCDVCSYALNDSSPTGVTVTCERCGKHHYVKAKSPEVTLIFSLTALIFYLPANFFPFMTMELYGSRKSATIWSGVKSLNEAGSTFIAIIVLLASIVFPLIKLLALFYLSATAKQANHQRFKTKLYHIVEAIGRWSMLDIFLMAIMVAIIKFGHWTSVEPEVGSLLFALVVIFTLIASTNFDPKLIWESSNNERDIQPQ